MRWPAARDQELLDAMLVLYAVAVRTRGRGVVPDVVGEFVDELDEQVRTSASGSRSDEATRLDQVSKGLLSPDEVGREVGVSGRQVRAWCAAGLVDHEKAGRAYRVDLVDARRHAAGIPR